jgi:mRNA-degrading endonuclease RelE of RelBE toxin-antitoxin system
MMAFKIELSPDARDHLKAMRRRDQQIIVDAVAGQLTYQPDQPTTHRKHLQENPVAPWELRVGDYRVFYDINLDDRIVVVVAVGHKSHNRLSIGGEEIEL